MAPRGVKRVLTSTAPSKLCQSGKFKAFRRLDSEGRGTGENLKGLTKMLEKAVFSRGKLPEIALRAAARRPGGHWGGPSGGRRRGARVDAQVSRIINAGPSAAKGAHVYSLTKSFFAALTKLGLTPVCAQRPLCHGRVGTAADVIAYDEARERLVVVELKSGFDLGRDLAARDRGEACRLAAPLAGAADTTRHRHLCQLLATWSMFCREQATLRKLQDLGVPSEVDGMLIYCCDESVEAVNLCDWWKAKGPKLLETLQRAARAA